MKQGLASRPPTQKGLGKSGGHPQTPGRGLRPSALPVADLNCARVPAPWRIEKPPVSTGGREQETDAAGDPKVAPTVQNNTLSM